ncbi:Methyl viologen resistance protein YddG [Tatumella ptyseos]|uniref:Methyl viologen resistance protein YddG n=1 Tax=Tatumella ptyseos TaxID=82987 RepID=A0A2X5R7N6_9GAMM|nr:Methyl viologen resistance protein YddG [Tatumella ptyseos]
MLFVAYEICLSLSIGFAQTDAQAIEVGMVNYLWPSLTLLFALIADKRRPGLLMLPGILLCFAGVGKVLGGEQGFSLHEVTENIASNPLSYGMAFAGAIIWGIYCVLTKKLANGNNGITLFFALTAVALWVKFFFSDTPAMHFSPECWAVWPALRWRWGWDMLPGMSVFYMAMSPCWQPHRILFR